MWQESFETIKEKIVIFGLLGALSRILVRDAGPWYHRLLTTLFGLIATVALTPVLYPVIAFYLPPSGGEAAVAYMVGLLASDVMGVILGILRFIQQDPKAFFNFFKKS